MKLHVFSAGFSFALVLFLSVVSRSESNGNVQTTQRDEVGEINKDQIEYNLINDEIIEPNKFHISYEITYDEFTFKRSEKCIVVEVADDQKSASEFFCSGKTKFTRTGDIKNITNVDDYTYSSNGFNHTGKTFKVSGNYYRVSEIDLIYGLQAEPITLKLNDTNAVKKIHFDRIGKYNLAVNFTINSTFFAMNRTENFSVASDKETNTDDLVVVGQVKVFVKNSDTYQTVQIEDFTLDENYSFVYVSEANILRTNDNASQTASNYCPDY